MTCYVDPSAAEFSRRRRKKIGPAENPPKKNSAGRKSAGKTKFGRRRIFLRPIFGGGAKNAITAFSTSRCREQQAEKLPNDWLLTSHVN